MGEKLGLAANDAVIIVGGCIILLLYFVPTIVAFSRNHRYRWVIFALNIFGITGLLWIAAFLWAVWPGGTNLTDPVITNTTGLSARHSEHPETGSTSSANSFQAKSDPLSDLARLTELRKSGTINQDEFEEIKKSLIAKSVRPD